MRSESMERGWARKVYIDRALISCGVGQSS
jgi:hypothetical protein